MAEYKNLIRMRSEKVQGVEYVKEGINLCRLPNGLICIGCCGFDFAKDLDNKVSFVEALIKSTKEFETFKDKSVLEFKNRCKNYDLHDCGLCKHLILKDKTYQNEILIENFNDSKIKSDLIYKLNLQKHLFITCPLHPSENNGEEFRQDECDMNFMCETQKMFLREWGEWTKEKFVNFVLSKNLDWFEYSKKMHDNSLVKEFFKEGLVTNYFK